MCINPSERSFNHSIRLLDSLILSIDKVYDHNDTSNKRLLRIKESGKEKLVLTEEDKQLFYDKMKIIHSIANKYYDKHGKYICVGVFYFLTKIVDKAQIFFENYSIYERKLIEYDKVWNNIEELIKN